MAYIFMVLLAIRLQTCNPYIIPSGQEAASLQSAWPYGNYALPMSSYGCPEAGVYQWETGYINLTLNKNAKAQAWNDDDLMTFEPYLMGPYHTHSFQWNFCVRRKSSDPWIKNRPNWPAGHYCIYRAGDQCPAGFSQGSITMTGYHFRDSDMSGTLPSMEVGNSSELTLFHCCRSDSVGETDIMLPNSFPFFLLSSQDQPMCQNIAGMVSKMDFFNMSDSSNEWTYSGSHSYVDRSTHEHVQLYYCHYIPKHDKSTLETIGERKPLFTHFFLKEFDPFNAVDGIFAWHPVNFRLVGTYVSKNQWDFINYGALRCDDIRYPNGSMRFVFECRRPIIGQYVTIRNFDTTDPVYNYGKFFVLSINEIRVIGKHIPCGKRLGMMSGDIFDYQLEVSSKSSLDTHINDGRLGTVGKGWCPHPSDMDPWFMVDLIVPMVVQGILVQGWDEGATRVLVSDFLLAYGINRNNMSFYQDPHDVTRVFRTLNYLKSTAIQRFILKEEIFARFLKIQPIKKEWNQKCLKLEFIGCPKRITRDIRCRPGTLDYGFEEQQYHSWWLDQTGRLDKVFFRNVTAEQCRELASKGEYISYSSTRQGTRRQECIIHEGHRYETEWGGAWLTNMADFYFAGQRLCLEKHGGCGMDSGHCFQTCTSPTGYIATEGYPAGIFQTEACTWKIEGTFGQFVSLDIIELDISLNGSCVGTFVSVYDVSLNNQLTLMASMCKYNRTYDTFTSGWHRMQVEFRTFGGNGNGFLGFYRLLEFTQGSFPEIRSHGCPDDNWQNFGGSCYIFERVSHNNTDAVTTWLDARKRCQTYPGGHLVSINSKDEMAFLHFMMTKMWIASSTSDVYIGFVIRSRMQPRSLSDSNQTKETVFTCQNGEMIARAYVCDKRRDCTDNSDEEFDCDYCSSTQYQCADGVTCISIGRYCDFRKDCPDNSDEADCVRIECSDQQMTCRNQQCIPRNFRCDMKRDCMDGSDEENCEECGENHFRCYDQSCMRKSRVCDGQIDCGGLFHEDEDQACEQNTQRSCAEWWYLGMRKDGEYLTTLGTDHALPVNCKFLKRNGKNLVQTVIHHPYEEPITVTQGKTLNQHIAYTLPNHMIEKLKDENVCYQTISMKCHFTILQSTSWQGGFSNETEVFSLTTTDTACSCPMFFNCNRNQTRCNCSTSAYDWYTASTTEVRHDFGTIDDERYLPVLQIAASVQAGQQRYLVLQVGPLICENDDEVQTERYLCRSRISINYTYRCLRDYDEYGELKGCKDLSHLDDCENFVCPPDYVKCPGRYCIPIRLMCDGTDHCPEGQDEHFCNQSCPGLYRCHSSDVCIPRSSVCDGLQQCPNGDDEAHCYNKCPNTCLCTDYTVTCRRFSSSGSTIDFHPETRKLIFVLSDFSVLLPEFDLPLLGELNLSNSGISQLRSRNFLLLKNLYSLDLSYNKISQIVASVFEGLTNLKLLNLEGNTQLQHVYENGFFGLSKLPEVVISYTSIMTLPTGTFKGLDSIQVLHVTDNRLTKVEDDAFASLSSLSVLDIRGNAIKEFSDGIFRGLSNLTKLYTDAYMFCCLKPEKVTEANCFPYQDEFSSCDDLMREDTLRAFLWIIGLSAFVGNICVVLYKCMVDQQTLKKAHGIFITNLGISDFCMGVYMLIIASADSAFRGRYVWNDLAWRNGNTCKFAGVLATVSSEASVIFLLLITIDRFVTIKFPFGQVQIGPKKAKWACLGVWVFAMSVAVVPLVATSYFKGSFYSRSAVCLALPLTRDRPPGWEFGTVLFIFLNFFVFVGIAIGQICIYNEISSDDKLLKSQRHFQDAAIARSLFLVVFSDFLCWFPVGVMGLMALSGRMIPGSTYAWTAVFILPINSALNPIIYTFTGILKKKKYQGMNFGRSVKKTAYDTNAWRIWTSLCQKETFMLGNHPTIYTPLAEVMTKERPSVRGIYKVVLEIIRGVTFLHDNDLVNGRLSDDNVLLKVQNKRITKVVVRLQLAVQEVEKPDDISDVGKLTIRLLKWYQKQIGKSKTKLSRRGAM
ncbi:uncharacterized protein LOC132544254 [Ylistrum balloti]|uniref:uncharacterized protein LOC132544254 n=1 Tax=Ylistrum balloti TaxID=509963 RepID=UPI0029058831|nr:uncharacterized protein LOC132544254 [Ylistrum balloti]